MLSRSTKIMTLTAHSVGKTAMEEEWELSQPNATIDKKSDCCAMINAQVDTIAGLMAATRTVLRECLTKGSIAGKLSMEEALDTLGNGGMALVIVQCGQGAEETMVIMDVRNGELLSILNVDQASTMLLVVSADQIHQTVLP